MAKASTTRLEMHDLAGYRAVLARYFRRRAHPADVDDLVQEVLLSVHARQTATPIDNIEGYLFTVAARALARTAQGRRRYGWAMDDEGGEFAPEEISAERILIGRESLATVVETITSRLPERTREVFVLHRFEEMTYPAIAATLSISVSAVEKHIMSALKILAADLRCSQ